MADLKKGEDSAKTPKPRTTSKKKATGAKKGSKKEEDKTPRDTKEKSGPAKKRGGATTRPGPKALLSRLIDEGYFAQRRTIGEVLKYAAESLAHHYKSTDFGSTLTRLLQEGRLQRERNDEGQYEYWS